MYLIDTNVWLERLLDQDKSFEVGEFFSTISSGQLAITDFTFHSICVILTRLARTDVLLVFVQDVFLQSGVRLVTVGPESTGLIVEAIKTKKLDFDDAYQYVASEINNFELVSFDSDFDNTSRGKKTPAEVLAQLSQHES